MQEMNQQVNFTFATSFSHYFFIGVSGTGMSAIAQYLRGKGKKVSGSDRLFEQCPDILIKKQLEQQGIRCFIQDGSGLDKDVDAVVISSAIEESNVELRKARQMGIPVMKRAELLAAISARQKTIAVAGTSGKSTTTAMIFHILQENGYQPSLMSGAGLIALQKKGWPGNAWVGGSDWLVIEADESDGSIVHYRPEIAVLLNIGRDHKEQEELIELFSILKSHTGKRFIVNRDCPALLPLSQGASFDFGTLEESGIRGTDFCQQGFSIRFRVNSSPCVIPVIGKHNMENALAAIGASVAAGIPVEKAAASLATYEGIYRRMQLVGEKNGIFVIDDFAHNPQEIVAAITSCQQIGKCVYAWFQPHGFGPLAFMYREMVETIPPVLREGDVFILSEVYYAGGTVQREITAGEVAKLMQQHSSAVKWINPRDELIPYLKRRVKAGDVILLMGARDPSLENFAKEIFQQL